MLHLFLFEKEAKGKIVAKDILFDLILKKVIFQKRDVRILTIYKGFYKGFHLSHFSMLYLYCHLLFFFPSEPDLIRFVIVNKADLYNWLIKS